jgi:hypothetical protein
MGWLARKREMDNSMAKTEVEEQNKALVTLVS